jgi:hypothetical protein
LGPALEKLLKQTTLPLPLDTWPWAVSLVDPTTLPWELAQVRISQPDRLTSPSVPTQVLLALPGPANLRLVSPPLATGLLVIVTKTSDLVRVS